MRKVLQLTGALLLILGSAQAQEKILGKIIVENEKHNREDAIVSVSLDRVRLDLANHGIQLYEVTGKKRTPVQSQLEEGYATTLWWVMSGHTAAGKKRTYELVQTSPGQPEAKEDAVALTKTDEQLSIHIGGKHVLSYRIAPLPAPEGQSPLYERSGFIHPLSSPKGEVLTRVQPSDHYHHVGVWNPWTHTEFEGREIDFWNLNKAQGTVRSKKVTLVESGPVMGRFKAIHEHIDLNAPDKKGYKVALNEEWEIRAWKVSPENDVWLVDFVSSLNCATASPLTIKKYRYQGFGFRATPRWDDNTATLLTSEGKNKADGNGTRARWCDVNGVSDYGTSGVLFMTHPTNFNYPEQLRIWPEGANKGKENVFFNFNPAQDRDWKLTPGRQYTLRYRMMVYDGKIAPADADQAWQNFANPPKAKLIIY